MNRRGFLQSFAAVPVAAALAPELLEALLPRKTIMLPARGGWPHSVYTYRAFGLAPIKQEGAAIAYDLGAHAMNAAQFRALVAPGLNRGFTEQYAQQTDLQRSEWEEALSPQTDLFDDDDFEPNWVGLAPPR